MTSDLCAARVLNAVMFVVLGAALLALISYSFAGHLGAVRDIYLALSPEEKRHVVGLANGIVMLALAVTIFRNLVVRWLGNRRVQPKAEQAK